MTCRTQKNRDNLTRKHIHNKYDKRLNVHLIWYCTFNPLTATDASSYLLSFWIMEALNCWFKSEDEFYNEFASIFSMETSSSINTFPNVSLHYALLVKRTCVWQMWKNASGEKWDIEQSQIIARPLQSMSRFTPTDLN